MPSTPRINAPLYLAVTTISPLTLQESHAMAFLRLMVARLLVGAIDWFRFGRPFLPEPDG
jgi:hypothetical protein